jgi:hypothetical protein
MTTSVRQLSDGEELVIIQEPPPRSDRGRGPGDLGPGHPDFRQVRPAHPRHDDIGQHQADRNVPAADPA